MGLDRAAALPRDRRRRAIAPLGDLATRLAHRSSGVGAAGAVLPSPAAARRRRAGSRSSHVDLFSIARLRSGLTVLGAQYAITAGLFFMVPVYLQMTLGLDALQTGIRIFPLSISLILFSVVGTRLSRAGRRAGSCGSAQWILVASAVLLFGSVDPDLQSWLFAIGMFLAGSALGLLASQLGNVNMSGVAEKDTSEVGGLQGVFQNLGSSLGTALIGSILIGALATSFAAGWRRAPSPTRPRPSSARPRAGRRDRARGGRAPDRQGGRPRRARRRELDRLHRLSARLAAHRVLRAHRDRVPFALFFSRGIPTEVLGRPDEEESAVGDGAVKGAVP